MMVHPFLSCWPADDPVSEEADPALMVSVQAQFQKRFKGLLVSGGLPATGAKARVATKDTNSIRRHPETISGSSKRHSSHS
jgi:hypothetical protein